MWKTPKYKRNNRDLPPKISTQALIYGYFRYFMNGGQQTLDMKFYNSTVSGTNRINIGQLASTIWNQPHIVKLRNLYDQYKFTGVSITYKHAGSMVQDDNTKATIPTPVAVSILFTDNDIPDFQEVLVRKPSMLLSLSDKNIKTSVPEPNTYKDTDVSSTTWPISCWLYMEPADTSNPTAEYYTEIAFNLTFNKNDVKISSIPHLN